MTKHKFIAIAAVAMFVAGPAAADVINFDELAFGGSGSQFVASPYSAGGFTFTSTGGVIGDILPSTRYLVYGNGNASQVDPDGAALVSNRRGALNTVTSDDGMTFDFNAIDLSGTINSGDTGGTVRFYANDDVDNFLDLTFASDNVLTTFDVGFFDVSSVSFFGLEDTPFFNFDNVTLNDMADVPEPGALGLLGIGLFGAGFAARKRRA